MCRNLCPRLMSPESRPQGQKLPDPAWSGTHIGAPQVFVNSCKPVPRWWPGTSGAPGQACRAPMPLTTHSGLHSPLGCRVLPKPPQAPYGLSRACSSRERAVGNETRKGSFTSSPPASIPPGYVSSEAPRVPRTHTHSNLINLPSRGAHLCRPDQGHGGQPGLRRCCGRDDHPAEGSVGFVTPADLQSAVTQLSRPPATRVDVLLGPLAPGPHHSRPHTSKPAPVIPCVQGYKGWSGWRASPHSPRSGWGVNTAARSEVSKSS